MIRNMAGCKGTLPVDTSGAASGLQLIQQHQELIAMDGSRNLGLLQNNAVPKENVEVDLREVYFLVMHFLANGPCTRAVGQLWNELLQHKLLPRRYHAWYSRNHLPSGDENDDGLSFPLSYRDIAYRHPNIPNNHLVDLLQQLLVNDRRAAAAADAHSKVVTAADTPTLLGSGSFSLLDAERTKHQGYVFRWTKHMRWPHWHADQVHGLMLREVGGGFARHHRAPSVRTASYVIAKPSVFFHRIQIIKKLRGHRNAVYCAIFDRTGQHVITGSDDRLVKIWSTETGLCLRSCRGHEGDITDLAVNSSNSLVASSSNDFSIRVWRLPDGYPISTLRGHGGAVTAIEFSPRQGCEHHLLSSSDDGTCRIWDARDACVNSRVYMPDPKENQSAARGATLQVPPAMQPSHQILCCAFNADGSIFVTGSSDKLARVWNATKWNDEHSGRPNYELDTLQGHENDVNYVQFSGCAAPSRPSLLDKEDYNTRFKNTWSAHDSIVTCSRDGSAIIWTPRPRRHHAKAGRWIKAYHLRVPPPPNPPPPPRPGGPRQRLLPTPRGVNMVVWSLDNRFVLAAIMDCRICVWNAVDGSLVHSLTGHDKQTYVLDVHPFNPRIAMSAGYDGRVIIWDIWDGHPIRIYETGDYNLVDGNFSPDGSSLVVSDEVGQIYLFATGEGNSQKDAKYDQFFLGDFRPLVRDTHGNVLDQVEYTRCLLDAEEANVSKETQMPPHQRNIQDLLCDASMIPYAEPYQTNYQQRRLGALGIDWQPPAVFLAIGTFDDPTYMGPPDPPVPFQAPVVLSPDRRERRTSALEGGNRWVEQPNENEEAMDWEQDAVGVTEDSGSEYSASEESDEDGERADTQEDADSEDEEEEEENEEEDDEGSEDIGSRLRRSSRNKRKAELVTYSSSGRRLKRKRYDDAGDQGCSRRSLRRRKVKPGRNVGLTSRHQPESSSRRHHAESSRRHHPESSSRRHQAEPSTRPKRLAARNALHFFSSIYEEDDEEAPPQVEKKVSEHGERASGSGEPQRVLRSRNREEPEELSKAIVIAQANKVESSDLGEFSRRPRSARKLVVKLRSAAPKVDLEDSKCEPSDEPLADTSAADQTVISDATLLEDNVGTSKSVPVTHKLRKLVIKYPRPSVGMKRNVAVIDSSEDNHYDHGDGNDIEARTRNLGHKSDSDADGYELNEDVPDKNSWQWKKGKAAKRARGHEFTEGEGASNNSDDSDGCPSAQHLNEFKEVQDEWDGISQGKLSRRPDNMQGEGKDSEDGKWGNGDELKAPLGSEGRMPSVPEADMQSSVERLSRAEVKSEYVHESKTEELQCSRTPYQNGIKQDNGLANLVSDGECKYSPKRRHHGGRRDGKAKAKDRSNGETSYKPTVYGEIDVLARVAQESEHRLRHGDQPESARERYTYVGVSHSETAEDSLGKEAPEAEAWDRERAPADEGSAGPDVSERPMSSQCWGDDRKHFLVSVDKQFDSMAERQEQQDSDHETDMMEGERNDDGGGDDEGGEEVGESMQQTDSGGGESDEEENSQSELFEGNGVSGKNWGESGNRETDEESVDEGKRISRQKRQKALGELPSNGRQESTSNRHNPNLEVSGKTRTRQLQSVLLGGGRQTRSRAGKQRAHSTEPVERISARTRTQSTKDAQSSWQNGSGERVLRTRGRHQDLANRNQTSDTRKVRNGQGSVSEQEGQEGSVEFERRRSVRNLDKLEDDDSNRNLMKERRTSGRGRREDLKKEQLSEKERGRNVEDSSELYTRDFRGKRNRMKPDRKKKDVAWLLLTDVEAGTRYIPQYGDDVAYLRQGHQEFLDSSNSEEKGPWKTLKSPIRAVEFCRIIELEYVILPESDQTCCKLTLEFTDCGSKVLGKSFKITFPELTNFPDFIVEKSRYDCAINKGWVVRDKCQVWWRSDDEVGGGQWWDGRVQKVKAKSTDFPDSPWDRLFVQYKLDSSEPTSHSPWELFEPGNHWHDPPRIDDGSKATLLAGIQELEKSCYVGNEDEYGLRRLSRDVEDPAYLNCTPLPLDLETVKHRLEKDYYHSLRAFRHDVELLLVNVQGYYGKETEQAAKMQKLAQVLFEGLQDEPISSDGNDYEF